MSSQHESPSHHPLVEGEPRRTIGDTAIEAEETPTTARQPSFRSWDETDHHAHASSSSGSDEQRRGRESSASGSDDLELLDEGEDDEESRDYDLRSKNGALYSRIDSQDDLGDDEYLEQVEASLAGGTAAETEDERRRRRKRKTRRVYGGGRRMYYADASSSAGAGASGRSSSFGPRQHSILETSWILFINHISPGFVLLIPYAYSLTGIAFGIPLIALLLALGASFAQLILTVEARYVGAGSYPSLASAVFPQVLNVQYLGEILINLFVCFVGLARTLIALVISSDLVIQLLTSAFPRARILHSYIFISLLMGLSYFITSLLLVRFSSSTRPLFPTSPFLSQLPSLSVLLYPLGLFILAISLKNLEDYPSLLKPDHGKVHWRFSKPHFDTAPLHTPTLWSGVSILFLACCSSQGSTFETYRGLRKRALPGSRNVKDPNAAATVAASPNDSFLNKMIQRHRWESATSLAVIYTFLLYLFSGLIGYLNLLIITPNLMTALPINHAWFNVCRILFLLTILPLLSETNIRPVRIAAIGLLDIPRKIFSHARSGIGKDSKSATRRKRPRGSAVSMDGNDTCSSSEDEDVKDDLVPAGASRLARAWQGRMALIIIWALVIVFSCLGRGFRNIASVAEIVGCVGITWLSFILPSIFHIILFHVRRPRTIFVSDASAPDIQTDALLLAKENQLQRRLMGKRIWMDLVAFGLLLPVGIIGFGRGIWAIASS